jgi:hypothetical protein
MNLFNPNEIFETGYILIDNQSTVTSLVEIFSNETCSLVSQIGDDIFIRTRFDRLWLVNNFLGNRVPVLCMFFYPWNKRSFDSEKRKMGDELHLGEAHAQCTQALHQVGANALTNLRYFTSTQLSFLPFASLINHTVSLIISYI